MRHGWLLAFAACNGELEEPSLTLEGPVEVRVEKLGPVAGPRALRADGTEPVGVVWTVSDAAVASVHDGAIVALAPGKTQITGTLDHERVEWNLTVDPTVVLGFVSAPVSVTVGQDLELKVEARAGEQLVPAGAVDWSTSNPGVLTVTSGKLHGVSPGTAYISAKRGASEAMAQIEVQAAP